MPVGITIITLYSVWLFEKIGSASLSTLTLVDILIVIVYLDYYQPQKSHMYIILDKMSRQMLRPGGKLSDL